MALQELVADGYHRPPEAGGEFVWFRDDAERFLRLRDQGGGVWGPAQDVLRFVRSRGELPGGGKSRSAIACKVTAVREGCRAYLIAECRARFKLVDLRSVRSEFAASEKGPVKDGEGLLEAMVTGQIGSLHFVAIAKQWLAVERSWCSGIARCQRRPGGQWEGGAPRHCQNTQVTRTRALMRHGREFSWTGSASTRQQTRFYIMRRRRWVKTCAQQAATTRGTTISSIRRFLNGAIHA